MISVLCHVYTSDPQPILRQGLTVSLACMYMEAVNKFIHDIHRWDVTDLIIIHNGAKFGLLINQLCIYALCGAVLTQH